MLYRVLILLSDWQIRPTAVSDLSSQRLTDLSTSKDLAAWLPSCLAAKSAPRTTSRAPARVPPPREALPIIYT